MSTITNTTTPELEPRSAPRPRRGPKRRWLVPVAAVAAVATGAGAWAITRGDEPTSTSMSCPGDADGSVAVIRAVSGDPVADCVAEWRRAHDAEPPAMTAYRTAGGDVVVKIDGQAPPDGATALAPGTALDTRAFALVESLDDLAGDLASGCLDERAARAAVQGELDRLDLATWTVVVDPGRPIDAGRPCGRPLVDPAQREVQLIGVPQPVATDDPYEAFALDLDAELAAACVGLAEAEDLTEQIAARTDVSELTDVAFTAEAGLLHVSTVEEPSAECTTASVSVGGRVDVVLRGPAS